MSRQAIPKCGGELFGKEPGPWWLPAKVVSQREGGPPVESAYIKCKCGYLAGIRSHTIEANGDVNPSVVCDGEGCDFHEFVTLEGWTP